jgi:L,D-transpeptidase catalytic domain
MQHWLARFGPVLLALTISAPRLAAAASEALEGISFAEDPHMLFVPVEEIASALGWEMQLDQQSGQISLNGYLLDAAHLRKLTSGTSLVPLDELQHAGATITWSDDGMQALVAGDHKKVAIQFASKRVEVDLANQRLRAYQGPRLVLDSRISTGREGKKTPSGEFKAGPVKVPMHRSRLYHNAPMPWSVQVHENIFIHGFQKVPRHPSSHGCIRLPLAGANPAKWFYDWIDIGTPIGIKGHWPPATVRVERSTPFARSLIQKVIIAIATTVACIMVVLFVWRGRGKV